MTRVRLCTAVPPGRPTHLYCSHVLARHPEPARSDSSSMAQHGQALVLGMLLAGAVALAFVRYFDAGMVVAGKSRQDHALDAAAYSGALVQARALNLLSYVNRAQVAHQVAMAHLVTLGSLAHFAGAEATRTALANPPAYVIGMHFGADHAQAYLAAVQAAGLDFLSHESGPLASAYAEHDRVARSVLSSVSGQIVAGLGAARDQAMQEVLAANYPGEHDFALSVTDDTLSGFLLAHAGNPRMRPFLAHVSSLYGFLDPRDHTAKSAYPPDMRCPSWRHELRRRGATVLDQGGRWQSIDTQSYHAVRSNRWIGCYYREYAMGWGWIPPMQSQLINAPHVPDAPENFADQDFWRWVAEATNWDILGGNANPLANSWAFASRRQWAGGGLPVYHDLAATHPEATASFTVSLVREGRAGISLHSTSAAEAFFRRPQLRADGRRELPGTFHPYWQARLRTWAQPRRIARHRRHAHETGQALVEALVAAFALTVLWVAIHWLAHYQDIALSAVHASRHSAFEATRMGPGDHKSAGASVMTRDVTRHFRGDAYRWADRRGARVFNPDTGLVLTWAHLEPLSAAAQPGRGSAHAAALRNDFALADGGLLKAELNVNFKLPLPQSKDRDPESPGTGVGPLRQLQAPSLLHLEAFELPYPALRRATSILVNAGHASSDHEVQARTQNSALAWANAYRASQSVGQTIASRADGVDEAWGRDAPTFEWLQPWSGQVPPHLLSTYSGG